MIRFAHGTDLAKLDALPGVTPVGTPSTIASATLEQGADRVPGRAAGDAPGRARHVRAAGHRGPLAPRERHPAGTRRGGGGLVRGRRAPRRGDEGHGRRRRRQHRRRSPWSASPTPPTRASTRRRRPGLIWVLPATLQQVEKIPSETEEVVGLRVGRPVRQRHRPGRAGGLQRLPHHHRAVPGRAGHHLASRSTRRWRATTGCSGCCSALFGIIALIAALYAIANVTAARVLVQRRDIAMLGALGFTPGQVVWALLVEQTALGVAATAVGLAGAWAATRSARVHRPAGRHPGRAHARCPRCWMALAAAVTVATVAVATVVPAWRAGRVSPVAAVAATPPRGRLSRLARVGLLVRLPVPLVLGARDAFTRRLPAALTIVGVAIPMAMITIALTCWTTLDGFSSDPGRIDLAAALTVYPGSESIQAEQAQLARDPQIAADYPGAEFDTLLPGATAHLHRPRDGHLEPPLPVRRRPGRDVRLLQRGDRRPGPARPAALQRRRLGRGHRRRRPDDLPHRRPRPSTPTTTATSSTSASTRSRFNGAAGRAPVLQPRAQARRQPGRRPAGSCCGCRATASRSSRPPTRPTASAWSGS